MTSLDDPEIARALRDATSSLEALHADLLASYPTLRGTLAIPGMLVGYGLGSFVANGLPDNQIVAHVLTIVAQIRQKFGKLQTDATDDDTVH